MIFASQIFLNLTDLLSIATEQALVVISTKHNEKLWMILTVKKVVILPS